MIGEKIREIRKKRGLTQIELAKKAGLNKNSIARYEINEISPTGISLRKITDALEISPSELFNFFSDEVPIEKKSDNEEINIGYWGAVFDNAKKVAKTATPQEISLILPLIKSAYELLAKINKHNSSEINIAQNIGRDSTINFNR